MDINWSDFIFHLIIGGILVLAMIVSILQDRR